METTDGIRWALDLGGDDYGLPGYSDFSGPRWDYFRLNNRGHNTLVLGGDLQNPFASAPITAFETTPERAYAVVDHSEDSRRGASRTGA